MKFYKISQCYYAQIEGAALFGIRIGYTTIGVAFWPPKSKRRKWWMPHVHVTLCSHTGQSAQWWIFRLRFHWITWITIGWKTKGDATSGHDYGLVWHIG
jgi:hypothetical protein